MILARRHARRGAVVLYVAVSLVALAAVAALTIDGGVMHDHRRHIGAAADASALSAAADLYKRWKTKQGEDPVGYAAAQARAVALANGYPNDGGANGTVVVNIPPKSGPFFDQKGYVEVLITRFDTRYFSRMFSAGRMMTTARAVARGSFESIQDGIIVLDRSVKGALNAHGGGSITIKGGAPVIVNSNHAEAAITNGSDGANVSASQFKITGGFNQTGSSKFVGPIETGNEPTPDPLAYLPAPDKATLPTGTVSKTPKQGGGGFSYTLTPGVYRGGLSFSGKDDVFMQPGVYYMDAGGFNFSGQGSLVGREVMVYNDPTAVSQRIDVTGQGAVELSPPSSGPYQGILFFQNRTSDVPVNIVGSGQYKVSGTFYAASAPIKVSGNGDAYIGSQYISRTLDLGGNGSLTIDYTAFNPPGKRVLQLVE